MKKILLPILITLLIANNLSAQWQHTSRVPSGDYTLQTDGNRIYTIALDSITEYQQIYYSEDSCQTWHQLNGLQQYYINTYSVNDSVIIVGGYVVSTNIYNILVSYNNGVNWNIKYSGTNNEGIRNLLYSDSTLIIEKYNDSCFLSNNLGATWNAIDTSIYNIKSFVSLNNNMFLLTNNNKLFKSSNLGINWMNISDSLPMSNMPIYSIISHNGNLFAINSFLGGGVFKSINYGLNWTLILPIDTFGYNNLSSYGNTIYAVTYSNERYFFSNDNGNTWIKRYTGIPTSSYINNIIKVNNTLFVGTRKGVYKSLNNGINWSKCDYGISKYNANKYGKSGNKCFVFGSGGFFKSNNNGNTWDLIDNPQLNGTFLVDDNLILAMSENGLIISLDTGLTWSSAHAQSQDGKLYGVMALCKRGNTIWAGTNVGNLFKSIDNGMNWLAVNTGMNLTGFYISALAFTNNKIYIGTNGAGIFYSSNNGISWASVNNGLFSLNIKNIVINGNVVLAEDDYHSRYKSTDYGAFWNSNSYGDNMYLIDGSIISSYPNYPNANLILTNNNYSNIINCYADNSFQGGGISNIFVENDTLYAGTTNNGIWKIPLNQCFPPFPASSISSATPGYQCQNQNITLKCSKIYGATSYIWNLPYGVTGNSNTDTIVVNVNSFDPQYNLSGEIGVKGHNSLGDSPESIHLSLSINPSYNNIQENKQICQGQSYLFGDTLRSISGTYIHNFHTYKGCDSIVTLYLTVKPFPVSATSIIGDTIVCKGTNNLVYSTSTISNADYYTWTLPNGATGSSSSNSIYVNFGVNAQSGLIKVKGVNNCGIGSESSLTIIANETPLPPVTSNSFYCQNITAPNLSTTGSNLLWYTSATGGTGSLVAPIPPTNAAGNTNYYVSQTVNGCEGARAQIIVTVNPTYAFTENHSICNGATYNWHGTNYSTTGTFTKNYSSINGCDSIYTLHLTVNPTYAFTENHSICNGETYNWHGTNYTTASTYTKNYSSINGCDSIYTLYLTVNPTYAFTENHSICNGATYNWHGTNYSSTGTFTKNYSSINGCDSIYTLQLTVNPTYAYTENHNICNGATYYWHGTNYSTAGTFTKNYSSINGCDSIYTLHLTVNPTYAFTENHSICNGETYNWHGTNYSAAGTFTKNYTTINGCDSIYTLHLNVNFVDISVTHSGVTITANSTADAYQWLNCDNGFAPINGEINQSFTATANGNYAVKITQGLCTDTSICIAITNVGIKVAEGNQTIKVYPNPVRNELIIEMEGNKDKLNFEILNSIGQVVFNGKLIEKTIIETTNFTPGVYLIKLENGKTYEFKKIVKE